MPSEEIYKRVMNFLDELAVDLGRDKYKDVLISINDEVGCRIATIIEEAEQDECSRN